MSVDYRKQLEDSKPRRERFPDQEQFEEALGYWMSHQGRILAMTRRTDGARAEWVPIARGRKTPGSEGLAGVTAVDVGHFLRGVGHDRPDAWAEWKSLVQQGSQATVECARLETNLCETASPV